MMPQQKGKGTISWLFPMYPASKMKINMREHGGLIIWRNMCLVWRKEHVPEINTSLLRIRLNTILPQYSHHYPDISDIMAFPKKDVRGLLLPQKGKFCTWYDNTGVGRWVFVLKSPEPPGQVQGPGPTYANPNDQQCTVSWCTFLANQDHQVRRLQEMRLRLNKPHLKKKASFIIFLLGETVKLSSWWTRWCGWPPSLLCDALSSPSFVQSLVRNGASKHPVSLFQLQLQLNNRIVNFCVVAIVEKNHVQLQTFNHLNQSH